MLSATIAIFVIRHSFLLLQMKGVFLVLTLLILVSVTDGAKTSCPHNCATTFVECTYNDKRCDNFDNCQTRCFNPYNMCKANCKKRRELLSRFALEDDDADAFFR